jgi:hypothetical protein
MTTLLHGAALGGRTDAIARLVREGSALEAKNAACKTPLHCAAGAGRAEAVALLLSLGADPRAETSQGHTPRFLAENGARKNDWKKVVELLDAAVAEPQPARVRCPEGKEGAGAHDGGGVAVGVGDNSGSGAMQDWSVEEVVAWLGSVVDGIFAPFCESFLENRISGDILIALSDTGLKSLGISPAGKRNKLLQVIAKIPDEQEGRNAQEVTGKRKAVPATAGSAKKRK